MNRNITGEEIIEEDIQDRIFRDVKNWEFEEKFKKYMKRKHPRIKKVRKLKNIFKNELPF